jgi:acyl carrier protein
MMDTATSIRDYIRDEVRVADGSSLADDTPLWGGVIDSVGLMQLIIFIEESFGVEIDDDELTSAHFGTISDIAALVDRKVALA